MPTTLTLKNIPDNLYGRLREAAHAHHRSLNGEAIARLEQTLVPRTVAPAERLARARRLRATLGPVEFDARDIQAGINEGRE